MSKPLDRRECYRVALDIADTLEEMLDAPMPASEAYSMMMNAQFTVEAFDRVRRLAATKLYYLAQSNEVRE